MVSAFAKEPAVDADDCAPSGGGHVGGTGSTLVNWVDALFLDLDFGLILLALKQWRSTCCMASRSRRRRKRMGALGRLHARAQGGRGRCLSRSQPEESPADRRRSGRPIAQTGIGLASRSALYIVFVAIASIGAAAPFRVGRPLVGRSLMTSKRGSAQQRRDHGRAAAHHRREADRNAISGFSTSLLPRPAAGSYRTVRTCVSSPALLLLAGCWLGARHRPRGRRGGDDAAAPAGPRPSSPT